MSEENSADSVSRLSQFEKIRLAASMRAKGFTVVEIADHFGVSLKTIYTYLQKSREDRLSELEACKSIDILVENLDTIASMQDLCLKMACQIAEEKQMDPITGEIIARKGSIRDKAEMLRLARDFLKMKIELEIRTGVLPSTGVDPYGSLNDRSEKSQADAVEDAVSARPELEKRVLERLEKQSWL